MSLYPEVHRCLMTCDAAEKVRVTRALVSDWRAGQYQVTSSAASADGPENVDEPGHPQKPALVKPRDLQRRSVNTTQGHAALIHAIAHIEFNAINLALDAVYRFRGLPEQYVHDWLKVADEEAFHFQLVREHLNTLGYDYGDFDAHNGLWEMAQTTAHDPLVRMALVPRVMEARGLDVTPGIIERLRAAGDEGAVAVLDIILRDEVGHVEIGTRWFNHLCDERAVPRQETFEALFVQYTCGRIKLPLHREARIAAGFSEDELTWLEGVGW